MKFDRAGWTNEALVFDPPYVRQAMLADVLENLVRVGMSRETVTRQMGEPTETNKFKDHGLVYYVGPEGGVGVDSRWLLIDFDKSGRVISFSVATD